MLRPCQYFFSVEGSWKNKKSNDSFIKINSNFVKSFHSSLHNRDILRCWARYLPLTHPYRTQLNFKLNLCRYLHIYINWEGERKGADISVSSDCCFTGIFWDYYYIPAHFIKLLVVHCTFTLFNLRSTHVLPFSSQSISSFHLSLHILA